MSFQNVTLDFPWGGKSAPKDPGSRACNCVVWCQSDQQPRRLVQWQLANQRLLSSPLGLFQSTTLGTQVACDFLVQEDRAIETMNELWGRHMLDWVSSPVLCCWLPSPHTDWVLTFYSTNAAFQSCGGDWLTLNKRWCLWVFSSLKWPQKQLPL